MKKLLVCLTAACLLFASCTPVPDPDNKNTATNQESNNQNQNQGNENNNDDPVPEPEKREFKIEGADEYSLVEISEDGKTITLKTGEGAPAQENGDPYEPEYTLSGDFEGQIVTTTKGTVLKLNGANLSNKDAPVISAPLKVEIKTLKDTENTITTTGTKDENNKTGAITGEKKVEIGGAGLLTVSGNVKHGIRGNEVEIKGSGTITVSATDVGSAINCNKFTVEALNKDDEPHSFTANLKDSSNGVKADKSISIGSGTFKLSNLKTGFKTDPNGTINIPESVSVNYENVTTEKEIPVAKS
ncbi:MAG: carbohydrate-binding domain-containing protein [Treponema sp.]|nr:carbohydrate-binding domain-containing protein [Treponema sp.]